MKYKKWSLMNYLNLALAVAIITSSAIFASDYISKFVGNNTKAAQNYFNLGSTITISVQQKLYPQWKSRLVCVLINNIYNQSLIAELDFQIDCSKQRIELDTIRVIEQYRKQGLGKKLFNFLKICCEHYRCKKITGEFGFIHEESQYYKDAHDYKKIFDQAKQFYIKQGCTITYPSKETEYPKTKNFFFCWENN